MKTITMMICAIVVFSSVFPMMTLQSICSGEIAPSAASPCPSRGPMADVTKLGDGSTTKDLVMTGGASNSSAYLTLPNDAKILDASLTVQGLGGMGTGVVKTFDYTHANTTQGWGASNANPSGTAPSSLQSGLFDAAKIANISKYDNKNATTMNMVNGNKPYHLFELEVDPGPIFSIEWLVVGYAVVTQDVYVWDNTGATWDLLKSQAAPAKAVNVEMTGFMNSGKLSTYVDTSNNVYLLFMSSATGSVVIPYVRTDYVCINVTYAQYHELQAPKLDVGQDGSYEWSETGDFKGPSSLTQANATLVTALQSKLTGGAGQTQIKLAFNSTTSGTITIKDIRIKLENNTAPAIPSINILPIQEDSGPNVIISYNLSEEIEDDDVFENLTILINNPEPTHVAASLSSDGFYLVLTPAQDYFGSVRMNITVRDKGLDHVAGNSDDKTVRSNDFMVHVTPTDDAPEILTVGGKDAAGNITFSGAEGATQGEWFNVSVVSIDIDGDPVTYSLNVSHPALTIDDNGNLSFLPSDLDVGTLHLIVNVTEDNATIGAEQNMWDTANLTIEVSNANDRPVLASLTAGTQTKPNKRGDFVQISALEDAVTSWTLQYADIDGDACTFDSNFTNPRFAMDAATGNCSFAPVQEDVGSHFLNITADDGNGGTDFIWIKVNVINVNDRPVNNNFTFVVEKNNVTLTANAGFDEDGDALIYKWDFGDGTIGQGIQQNHSFPKMNVSQNFTVTLKVSDGKLDSDIATRVVTIAATPDTPVDDDTNVSDDDVDDDIVDDDDNNTDDDVDETTFLGSGAFFVVVGIILLVMIILIVLVLVVVMRRKKEMEPQGTLPEPNAPPQPLPQLQQAPMPDPGMTSQPAPAQPAPQPAPLYYPPQQAPGSEAPDQPPAQPVPGPYDAPSGQYPPAQGPDMTPPPTENAAPAPLPEGMQAPPEAAQGNAPQN